MCRIRLVSQRYPNVWGGVNHQEDIKRKCDAHDPTSNSDLLFISTLPKRNSLWRCLHFECMRLCLHSCRCRSMKCTLKLKKDVRFLSQMTNLNQTVTRHPFNGRVRAFQMWAGVFPILKGGTCSSSGGTYSAKMLYWGQSAIFVLMLHSHWLAESGCQLCSSFEKWHQLLSGRRYLVLWSKR